MSCDCHVTSCFIAEDLYEELEPDYIPPVPDSPRPPRASIPPPVQDDFFIDEDIYEDTDDILPAMPTPTPTTNQAPSLPNRNPPTASVTSQAPSLPSRNPPKKSSSPPPSLPPRSAGPSKSPGLPPRNSPTKSVTLKPQMAVPPAAAEEELYDDVILGGDDVTAEIEETYDDVVSPGNGGAVEDDLYDDVVATTSGVAIQDEFYEDMAPGALDSYVTMERNGEEADQGEELYVDVDEPLAHTLSVGKKPPPKQQDPPKQSNTKTFSRMFQKKHTASEVKTGLSGQLSYKAPKKSKFDEKWAVIDGSNLLIYKTSSDKRSQDKIALGECRLELGSTEAGAGRFAFHLFKGDKVHHFSLREATELEEWVGVVKGLVKYAPVEVKGAGSVSGGSMEQEVYHAKEDHIAETGGGLTFKKGTYIRLITRESDDVWVGQIGTEDQVFEGKIGQFPASKVQAAEDVYF